MIKVLNLYAGIGGNRKLWENVEVTAIENDKTIAAIYKDFFPEDKVIVTDAHEYLLNHFEEYDFIWSSPPCPTHSRMNNLTNVDDNKRIKYPDMILYQEILILKHFFKGKFVVENVISYYNPLIIPQKSGNHYYWSNFIITNKKKVDRKIRREGIEKPKKWGFDLSKYNLNKRYSKKLLNNLVHPDLGLHIFNMAFKEKQEVLKVNKG